MNHARLLLFLEKFTDVMNALLHCSSFFVVLCLSPWWDCVVALGGDILAKYARLLTSFRPMWVGRARWRAEGMPWTGLGLRKQ